MHTFSQFAIASITSEDFNNYQSNIKELNVTAYEMIEIVSYACIGNVYLAYELLFENIHILSDVVEYMIQERFISNLKEALDSFNGVIENNDIIKEERFNFYECYVTIDKSFAEIKRNNVEYIK